MVRSLRVILWDDEIGRLMWDERRRMSYFTYNPEFIKRGLDISPFVAPVDGARGLAPVWGEEGRIYQKLPAFVVDSLPDAWGSQLFELWRQQNHLANAEITPLDKHSTAAGLYRNYPWSEWIAAAKQKYAERKQKA